MDAREPIWDPEIIIDNARNDEIFPDVMKTSIDFDRRLVVKSISALNEQNSTVKFFIDGYEKVSEKDPWDLLSAYICYNFEAFYTARRAMILGLNANYNNAFTLLRSVYEMEVQGAFFNCLSGRKFREKGLPPLPGKRVWDYKKRQWDWRPNTLESILIKINAFLTNSSKRELVETKSVAIFDVLKEINAFEADPKVHDMLKSFEFWLKSKAFSVYLPSTRSLYKRLSRNIHENIAYTDIGRHLLGQGEGAFVRPPVPIKKWVLEFLSTFHEVMDFSVAIQLSVFSLILDPVHFTMKAKLLQQDEMFRSAQFEIANYMLGDSCQ